MPAAMLPVSWLRPCLLTVLLLGAACATLRPRKRPDVAPFDRLNPGSSWSSSQYLPSFAWLHENDSTAAPATPLGFMAAELRQRRLRRLSFQGHAQRSPKQYHAIEGVRDGIYVLRAAPAPPLYDTLLSPPAEAETYDLRFDRRGYLTEARAVRWAGPAADTAGRIRWHLQRRYDPAGRLLSSVVAETFYGGVTPGQGIDSLVRASHRTRLRYDARGRVTQREQHWQGLSYRPRRHVGYMWAAVDTSFYTITSTYHYGPTGGLRRTEQVEVSRYRRQEPPTTRRTTIHHDARRRQARQQRRTERPDWQTPYLQSWTRQEQERARGKLARYDYEARLLWRRQQQPERRLFVQQYTSDAVVRAVTRTGITRFFGTPTTVSPLTRLLWRQRLSVIDQRFRYDPTGLLSRVETRTCYDRGCLQPQGSTRVDSVLAWRLLTPGRGRLGRTLPHLIPENLAWPYRPSERQVYYDFRYEFFE